VVVAFATASGFSVFAQREAVEEANLMRTRYFPLALALRDLVARQDTYNTQLNHSTSAKNPADIRAWFNTARTAVRPRLFNTARSAISRAFSERTDAEAQRVGRELLAELNDAERFAIGDDERLDRLFELLDRRELPAAELLRDSLVNRGVEVSQRLTRIEQHVERSVDRLVQLARVRERVATWLLVSLTLATLLTGAAMAVYARRVLLPLGLVTERAKAVALGDMKPRPAIVSNDEIGELSATFEGMVSAIARANEQLLSSERLATIGKMAAHVTHEIRNPLSSIALNLELLEEELPSGADEANNLLRAIKAEVERLSALSEQYLSVARQRPQEKQPEKLGEIVEEACEFVRRELAQAGIELKIVLEPDAAELTLPLDEAQVRQALLNLLRNAREAMPSGGAVVVRLERANGGLDLIVDDEGVGMPATTRERLFEPFFTTKRHGTGLGLAITKQVAEAHGGGIRVEAREPRGTRIVLHLAGA
ncbi:MAG TPA: HAMP domain-containing sensor histidine kinase, partial [Polyangiales bacterium]|nr:HAMP domain-containing sensor histidine kinase [Polyangiales bacterium]